MEGDHSTKTTTAKGASIGHGGGGKIPYANPRIFAVACKAKFLEATTYTTTDIPSMSGRQQEDGMHSQRTGKQILQ